MSTATDILARLQATLQLSDSSWDVSVGTPEYKILEAVANELANTSNNSTLQSYSFDINTMSGPQLDAFVALWGVVRLQGQRATGAVVFSSGTPAVSILDIPLGTQVFIPAPSFASNVVYYQTVVPALIPVLGSSVEVPIEAVLTGSSGNSVANTVTGISSGLSGVTSVANISPITGGLDPETDAQLRSRFQATSLRNVSGTTAQYLASVLDNALTDRATIIGPAEFYEESLQIYVELAATGASAGAFTLTWNSIDITNIAYDVSAATLQSDITSSFGITTTCTGGPLNSAPIIVQFGSPSISSFTYTVTTPFVGASFTLDLLATSTIIDSQYTYPVGTETVGQNLGAFNQNLGVYGTDYTTDATSIGRQVTNVLTDGLNIIFTNPPINSYFNPGNIVDLISEYTPLSSRALPYATVPILNKVDIYVDGHSPTNVLVDVAFQDNTFTTQAGITGTTWQTLSGEAPPGTDYFMPLPQLPILALPTSLLANDGDGPWYLGVPGDVQQTLSVTGASSGSLNLTWNSLTTADMFIGYNASAQTVQTALEALAGIGLITCTGGPLNTYPVIITLNSGSGDITISDDDTNNSSAAISTTAIGYYQVFDTTALYGSPQAIDGIGWTESGAPDSTDTFSILYAYNELVGDLNDVVQQISLVGQDSLVHSCEILPLVINLAIVYGLGTTPSQVNSTISTALTNYLDAITFLGAIRIADILQTVMNVPGILNVRLATSSDDAVNYGIMVLAQDGITVLGDPFTQDLFLESNQLAALSSVNTYARSQNSFGTGYESV